MENERSENLFRKVHRMVQERRDEIREAQQADSERRAKKAEERPNARIPIAPPFLIPSGNLRRCSVCGYPFAADAQPSMGLAFAEHLVKAHQPGQTTEDVNQTAARIVKEATDGR